MRSTVVLLLCLVGAVLVATGVQANNGIGPDACCLSFYSKPVSITKLRSYSHTDGRCSMSAVLLMTTADKLICVDPNAPWVQRALGLLDQRNI